MVACSPPRQQGEQSEQRHHYHHHQQLGDQQRSNSDSQFKIQQNRRADTRSPRPPPRSTIDNSSVSAPLPRHLTLPSDAPGSSRGSTPAIRTPSSSSTEADTDHSPTRAPFAISRRDGSDSGSDNGSESRHPAKMASWSGQPAVKGSSEAVRMVLLSFVTIGVTYVALDSLPLT